MTWITVKRSHYETDLINLKNLLEAEGIECFFKNEFTNQIMNHIATFSIELQVRSSDLQRVQEIMDQIEH